MQNREPAANGAANVNLNIPPVIGNVELVEIFEKVTLIKKALEIRAIDTSRALKMYFLSTINSIANFPGISDAEHPHHQSAVDTLIEIASYPHKQVERDALNALTDFAPYLSEENFSKVLSRINLLFTIDMAIGTGANKKEALVRVYELMIIKYRQENKSISEEICDQAYNFLNSVYNQAVEKHNMKLAADAIGAICLLPKAFPGRAETIFDQLQEILDSEQSQAEAPSNFEFVIAEAIARSTRVLVRGLDKANAAINPRSKTLTSKLAKIINKLAKHEESGVRVKLATSIGRTEPYEPIDATLDAAIDMLSKDSVPYVADRATQALGERAEAEASSRLTPLSDPGLTIEPIVSSSRFHRSATVRSS